MCGRIGLVTGRGIAGCVRRYSNRQVLLGAVLLLFIANTINVGADLGAMAASVQLLTPAVPFGVILIVFAVGILLLEIFVPYRYYARILKVLTLSLLAYLVTGILIHPDWLSLLRATLVPSIQLTPEFLALAIAVLGTTISPYLFFWQAAEEVEEEHEREDAEGAPSRHRHTSACEAGGASRTPAPCHARAPARYRPGHDGGLGDVLVHRHGDGADAPRSRHSQHRDGGSGGGGAAAAGGRSGGSHLRAGHRRHRICWRFRCWRVRRPTASPRRLAGARGFRSA